MLELDFGSTTPKSSEPYKGFVYDLDDKEYRRAEGISQSAIKTLCTEPWKYFNKVEIPKTPAMIEGTLMHLLFSEPHKLNEKFFILDDMKLAKRLVVEAEIGDRIPFSRGDFNRVQDCVGYVKQKIKERFDCDLDLMDGEVSFFGEYNGLPAKARADKITKDRKAVFDFKKCRSAHPKEFLNTACNLDYGIQEVFYRELMGLDDFVWIAIETMPVKVNGADEFMFGLFRASEIMRDIAKQDIKNAYKVLENPEKFKEVAYMDEFFSNSLEDGLNVVRELVPPLWRQKNL